MPPSVRQVLADPFSRSAYRGAKITVADCRCGPRVKLGMFQGFPTKIVPHGASRASCLVQAMALNATIFVLQARQDRPALT